jgi:hypothetical protein
MIRGHGAVRPHRPESTGGCGLFLILVGRAAWSRCGQRGDPTAGGSLRQQGVESWAFAAQILNGHELNGQECRGLPGKESGRLCKRWERFHGHSKPWGVPSGPPIGQMVRGVIGRGPS